MHRATSFTNDIYIGSIFFLSYCFLIFAGYKGLDFEFFMKPYVIFAFYSISSLKTFYDRKYYSSFSKIMKHHMIVDIFPFIFAIIQFFVLYNIKDLKILFLNNLFFIAVFPTSILANITSKLLKKYYNVKEHINFSNDVLLIIINSIICPIFWIIPLALIIKGQYLIGLYFVFFYNSMKFMQDYTIIKKSINRNIKPYYKLFLINFIPAFFYLMFITIKYFNQPKSLGILIGSFSFIYGLSLIVSTILNFTIIKFNNLKERNKSW